MAFVLYANGNFTNLLAMLSCVVIAELKFHPVLKFEAHVCLGATAITSI
jgi:hypothetical protein